MSVTEVVMGGGNYTLSLSSETPQSIRRLLLYGAPGSQGKGSYFSHVVITPVAVDLDIGDAAMLELALYSGRVMEVKDVSQEAVTITGDSAYAWLGDDSGKGPMLEQAVDLTDSNFVDGVTDALSNIYKLDFDAAGLLTGSTLVPSPIAVGTLTEPPHPAGLYSNSEVAITPRAVIDRLCQWFTGFVPTEVRVNPDFTIDGGPIYDLNPTNPKYILYDGFRRADAASLGTADTGQTWTSNVGTWEILSFRAHLQSSTAVAVASVDTTVSDFFLHAGIRTSTANGGTDVGIVFRLQDATNFLIVWLGGGTDRRIHIQKVVAGVYTDLAISDTNQWVPGTTIKISIHCKTDIVRVFLNDDELLSYQLSSAEYTQFGDETHVGVWTDGPDDDGVANFTYIAVDDFSQRPTALAIRKDSGRSPTIDGIRTRSMGVEMSVKDYATRSAVLTREGPLVLPTGIAEFPIPTPYCDPFGNPVVITSAADAAGQNPLGDPADDMALAQNTVEQMGQVVRRVSLTAEEYNLSGFVKVGDAVNIYDAERGLYDISNQVKHGGQWIYPIIMRILQITWPIVRGMGVYLRVWLPGDAEPTYYDLTHWVNYEEMAAGIEHTGRPPTAFELDRVYETLLATTTVGDYPGDIGGELTEMTR